MSFGLFNFSDRHRKPVSVGAEEEIVHRQHVTDLISESGVVDVDR